MLRTGMALQRLQAPIATSLSGASLRHGEEMGVARRVGECGWLEGVCLEQERFRRRRLTAKPPIGHYHLPRPRDRRLLPWQRLQLAIQKRPPAPTPPSAAALAVCPDDQPLQASSTRGLLPLGTAGASRAG